LSGKNDAAVSVSCCATDSSPRIGIRVSLSGSYSQTPTTVSVTDEAVDAALWAPVVST
jgi:hypothetical protein